MSGVVRWGIIGCGDVVKRKSGPAFQRAERSDLVAVMRRSADLAEAFATEHGVPHWTTDAGELIDRCRRGRGLHRLAAGDPPRLRPSRLRRRQAVSGGETDRPFIGGMPGDDRRVRGARHPAVRVVLPPLPAQVSQGQGDPRLGPVGAHRRRHLPVRRARQDQGVAAQSPAFGGRHLLRYRRSRSRSSRFLVRAARPGRRRRGERLADPRYRGRGVAGFSDARAGDRYGVVEFSRRQGRRPDGDRGPRRHDPAFLRQLRDAVHPGTPGTGRRLRLPAFAPEGQEHRPAPRRQAQQGQGADGQRAFRVFVHPLPASAAGPVRGR